MTSPDPSEAAVTEGPPLVLFDIDGVILGIDGTPLAGATALIDTLMCLGYEVHFWSAGGTMHVADALQRAGIYGGFTIHDKPTYPPSEAEALRIIGRRPALQIDDDPTERVADWAFMVWGYLRSQPSAPERPDLTQLALVHVRQALHWHVQGIRPTGISVELDEAERLLVTLRAEQVERPSLDVAAFWLLDRLSDDWDRCTILVEADGSERCDTHGYGEPCPVREARIVVDAPDRYAALQALAARLSSSESARHG